MRENAWFAVEGVEARTLMARLANQLCKGRSLEILNPVHVNHLHELNVRRGGSYAKLECSIAIHNLVLPQGPLDGKMMQVP